MRCPHCNEELTDISYCFGAKAPYHYLVLNEEDQKESELNDDLCVIESRDYFIRGHLGIPIIGSDEVFIWSVWSSISKENFETTIELWNSDQRSQEPGYFGWFSSMLPIYPETINLKCMIQTREVGNCPLIILEESDHPLSLEQRNGITIERVVEINHLLMHEA
ncbi:DUF2199 domain-containing protein [Paenibacillus sp. PL2-23]|uniref:DUF2199 domain-containing protein n=1 Tax=Paenibacillus sp. PL2-23 TaxID=2100729 RepID=UPI0030F9913A